MRRRRYIGIGVPLLMSVSLASAAPLIQPGESSVTFKLLDRDGRTPKLVLFGAPEQAATAESINFWRGTPGTKDQPGLLVEFKGIRFIRTSKDADTVIVRLIGIKNELELDTLVSLRELESGEKQLFRFGPVSIGAAGLISGTTSAEMHLVFIPQSRSLEVKEISGEFEWARVFSDPQKDAGSIENVTGEVGDVAQGAVVLRSPTSSVPKPSSESKAGRSAN